MEPSVRGSLRVLVRRQEPNCADCASAVLRVTGTLERLSKPVFQISSDDIIGTAGSIGIPREKINWRTVEKYIESYDFEGSYSVWDAIKDGLREGLNFPEDSSMSEVIDELDRDLRQVARTCKISDSDLQKLIIILRQNAGQDPGELRKALRETLQDYSRLSAHEYERKPRRLDTVDYQGRKYVIDERLREFRFMQYGKLPEFVPFDSPKGREMMKHLRNEAHETEGGQTGATIGALAASAAATGFESPELIPIVAPIGSAVGSRAEKEVRKRIKF
jgi:hypothetical protein